MRVFEPYGRAETPDAARMLFGALAPEHAARRRLDQTIAHWLEERRREGVPAAEGRRLDRNLREIMDAIRIVSVLSLQQTAADFRQRFLLMELVGRAARWNNRARSPRGVFEYASADAAPGPQDRTGH